MTGTQAQTSGERILAPDLARGMMLLFIALANVSAYLWGHESTELSLHPAGEGTIDTVLASLSILLVDGHVYPMFAFLFGYGITQFAYSRINRGIEPSRVSRMLLRRHLWLLVFGCVHALLLFAGDILGAYALTGLIVAPLLLRGSDRTIRILLWTVGSVIVGFMLLTVGAMLLLDLATGDMVLETSSDAFEVPGSADILSGIEHWFVAMLVRIAWWIASSVGAVFSLIIPFAVLLGGYAARYRWLEGATTRFSLKVVAPGGVAIGVVASLPAALGHLGVQNYSEIAQVAWMLAAQLGGIFGGLGYTALFALIGTRARAGAPVTQAIAAVGSRSLSSYLLQSVFLAPLLSAWGFGLGQHIGTGAAYLIATGVWCVSLVVAVLLERRGLRGPAERILRSLTYRSDDVRESVVR